jgi:hypothetical protein
MEDDDNLIVAVADAMMGLSYGEMMKLARTLCDMNTDMPRDLSKPEEWAELLHSWAETAEESLT